MRRRAVIGARGETWAPISQLRFSVAEVAEMLGPAFADLVDGR